MGTLEQAAETQLRNIETKTGQSRSALTTALLAQGFDKHTAMVGWLKQTYGLGHGDANAVAHLARQSVAPAAAADGADPLDAIYDGPRAKLRPIHDRLMAAIAGFGPCEVAPKKGYVALRRRKQFAMIGPKTQTQVELGINLKDAVSHPLVKAMPPGGMCQYTARLDSEAAVDAALVDLLRRAYDAAG